MSVTSAILALSPVGYWKLGETSGTTVNDEIGTNDGTYVGNYTLGEPSIVVGDAGTSVKFSNALGARIEIGDIFNFTGNAQYTALVFGKLEAYNSVSGHMLFENGASGYLNGWTVHLGNPAITIMSERGDATAYDRSSSFQSEASLEGSTHLYSAGYNGTDIKVGLDGTFVGTIGSTRSVTNDAVGLGIAANRTGGSTFDGWLQHAAIFDYFLTEEQLQSLLLSLDVVLPDADVTTTGWTTAPLFSKINDASDATVIQATAS